jgi:hypothetical protein
MQSRGDKEYCSMHLISSYLFLLLLFSLLLTTGCKSAYRKQSALTKFRDTERLPGKAVEETPTPSGSPSNRSFRRVGYRIHFDGYDR